MLQISSRKWFVSFLHQPRLDEEGGWVQIQITEVLLITNSKEGNFNWDGKKRRTEGLRNDVG